MRPIWKNHWLLFRSTHSQKSPEKRDFVVHTHKKKGTERMSFFFVIHPYEPTSLRRILRKQNRTKGATRKADNTVRCR